MVSPAFNGHTDSWSAHPGNVCAILAWNRRSIIAHPLEFYEQFSNHCATLLRAEGKDILSVRMHLNSERQAEEDVQAMASED